MNYAKYKEEIAPAIAALNEATKTQVAIREAAIKKACDDYYAATVNERAIYTKALQDAMENAVNEQVPA